jgi:hypothetical protein
MVSGLQKDVSEKFLQRERMVNLKKVIVFALAFVILLLLIPNAGAQEYGVIQATATVIAGITITGEHDLIFGSVLPGVDKSVDKSNVGFAGAWHIAGDNSAEITLDFTLPDSLLHIDSLAFLRISFNSTDASYDDGTGGGQSNPAYIINPNGPNTGDLGATGTMDVWIGGTVEPTISQTGGNYEADITLMVAYTGN